MFGKKKKPLMVNVTLLEGLPLVEGSNLMMKLDDNGLWITDDEKNEFTISFDKIKSIDYKNEVDMQQYVKQSVPGMIVGNATFGLLGAMVGGRVKTKEKRIVTHYILINYVSDGDKTIVTSTNNTSNVKIVDEFNKMKPKEPKLIEL